MDHKKYRKALCKCRSCYEQKLLVGQAFREYVCQYCKQAKMHPNTGVPEICPDCSNETNKCGYCLKKWIN